MLIPTSTLSNQPPAPARQPAISIGNTKARPTAQAANQAAHGVQTDNRLSAASDETPDDLVSLIKCPSTRLTIPTN